METNELFLQSDLKLPDLAERLDISLHSVSQVINERLGMSFPDYLNALRIQTAVIQLREHPEKKIIHIALDCGFNNKVSFLNAFKKHTGMSPSEYRSKEVTVG